MYVSCSLLACAKSRYPTVEEAIGRAAELGFRAIDLDAFEGWQHVSPSALAAGGGAAVEAVAAAVRAAGVTVGGINCGLSRSLSDPAAEAFERCREEFIALLALAERLGRPPLTVQPGGPRDERPDDELLGLVAGRVAELCRLAAGRGVAVGVEAHQGSLLEDPRTAGRFVTELCPAARLTYDPSHFVMQGIAPARAEPLLEWAVHVHVRDAAPGRMQAPFGRGGVDFARLVSALRARGYDGALAIEYFNDFDPRFESVRALREHLLACGVGRAPLPAG